MKRYPETLNLRCSVVMMRAIEAHAVFHRLPASEMARRLLLDVLSERPLVREWDEGEYVAEDEAGS